MPFLRLTIHPLPSAEDCARLAGRLTALMADALGKRADLTSVLVEAPGPGLWTIGGTAATSTAVLVAHVTAGTNSAEQKDAFIAAAHAALLEAVPALAPVAYVMVRELPADAWGYDGRTQAARQKPRPPGA